jgi:hypothetical protein
VPIVLISGNLNLLEPSGPVQTCNGAALHHPNNRLETVFVFFYLPHFKFVAINLSLDTNNIGETFAACNPKYMCNNICIPPQVSYFQTGSYDIHKLRVGLFRIHAKVQHGVLQDFILGPLLLSDTCMTDLPKVIKNRSVRVLFAVNTNILFNHSSIKSFEGTIWNFEQFV